MASANLLQRLSLITVMAIGANIGLAQNGTAQQTTTVVAARPVTVEWVYRVKYGFKDEWWQLFKKNQISVLEKQKQLGYVKEYTVYAPGLHTSEDARWDYRIIIVRVAADAPVGQSESEVARLLFPDQATYKREENRRWELTTNHWDLPIHVVNLSTTE